MINRFRVLFSSRIVRKLLFRILAVELASFLLILIISGFLLWPKLQQQAIKDAGQASEQIAMVVNQMQLQAMNSSKMILTSGELDTLLKQYDPARLDANMTARINLQLHKLVSSQDMLHYVHLSDRLDNQFDSISNTVRIDLNIWQTPWYQNIRASTHSSGFSSISLKQVPQPDSDALTEYYIMAYATNYYIGSEKITMTLFSDVGQPLKTADNAVISALDDYAIFDDNLTLIHAKASNIPIDDPIVLEMLNGSFRDQKTTRAGTWFVETATHGNWKILSFASRATLNKQINGIFQLTSLLFAFLVLLTFLLIAPVAYRIVKPVNRLAGIMRQVAEGDLNQTAEVETNDEIGELSHIFSEMVESLNRYIKSIYEHEEMEQRMKYSLLISQIDPHFIYNTMNILNSLARQGKTEQIIDINSALIRILQDRLRINEIQVYDTVRHEVEILQQYIAIINVRYQNKISVIWELDDNLMNEQIPKNLIQPLVENSFFHGLTHDDGQMSGELTIRIQKIEAALIRSDKDNTLTDSPFPGSTNIQIIVADNGNGMEPETCERINAGLEPPAESSRGRHIGIGNVRDRLAYLYRNQNCMLVESQPGKGTRVILTLHGNSRREVLSE